MMRASAEQNCQSTLAFEKLRSFVKVWASNLTRRDSKMRTSVVTTLSVIVFIDAVMWIVGVVPTLFYAFNHGALPKRFGFRLMGGPFEKLGIETLIAVGIVYIVVSALKILAAHWLWNSRMDGAVFELILLGLSAIFWYGFALPLGPLLGIIQVLLLMFAWGSLH